MTLFACDVSFLPHALVRCSKAGARLTASEGALSAGTTDLVLQWFPHAEGDLVVVRFGKATRVAPSTSIAEVEQARSYGARAAR
jgi:hypothetical protein